MPKWWSRLFGDDMPLTPASYELTERREEAAEANRQGDIALEQVRAIRSEAKKAHTEVRQTMKDNHFADLMLRALESR